MESPKVIKPVVSVKWLHDNLEAPNLIVLDASIPKVADGKEVSHRSFQIPKSRFFDIKNAFSDVEAPFPNTMPSEAQFTNEARKLGINGDSKIIVYDNKGIYSSARAWYMFKAMGHEDVAVLDGGLPAWKNSGYQVETRSHYSGNEGNFIAQYKPRMFTDFHDVSQCVLGKATTILDARSEERFKSLVPEPREGLRRGNIPGSENLPYTKLLNDGLLKDKKHLKMLFQKHLNTKEEAIVFSCGSGITACILALGAEICGYGNYSVYDGSWTEWGSLTNA